METLGPYQILRELGRGGFGAVYLALDPRIGRKVAIKTVLSVSDATLSESLRARFRLEAQAAGGLSHPHIVTIHEYDDSATLAYLVMEYVEGVTLAQKMEAAEPLPLDFALSVLDAACAALDFAHARNVVHRDVKPANVLIANSGLVKIADFGIAKILDADTGGLTATGTAVGTVHYMSPEQVSGGKISGRSDQFSLAVIAYEILTGRKPFTGDTWASVLYQIVNVDPAPVKQFREEIGDSVTAVLQKALAKEPADRYVNCESFVRALRMELGAAGPTGTHSVPAESTLKTGIPAIAGSDEATVTLIRPRRDSPSPAATPAPTQPSPPPSPLPSPAPSTKGWRAAGAGVVVALVLAAGAVGYRIWVSHPAPIAKVALTAASPADAPAAIEPALSKPAESGPVPNKSAKPVPATPTGTTPVPKKPGSVQESPKAVETPVQSTPAAPPPAVVPPVEPARTPVQTSVPAPAPPQPAPAPAPRPENKTPQPDPRALEADAWERVRTSTDVASLERFRAAFPNGSFQADAARRIEQLEYEQASRTNTAKAYRDFLAKYPSGPTSERATAELAKLDRAAQVGANRHLVDVALQSYIQAFERKDAALLKSVWPGLSAAELATFQNFFRIARSVKLQLQLTGEPDIAADGATVHCRRILTATDERGPLPTQDQMVTIRLRKSGDAMLIESVQTAGR